MATLWDVLSGGAAGDPAIVVPEGPALTYGELREQVARTADTLAALGIGREDRVSIVLPNGAEVILAFLGAAMAAAAAPLNPAYTEEEGRFYMEDTGAKALIAPKGGAEAARRAAPPGTVVIDAALEG